MTLLRAADLVAPPASPARPALSTLAALAVTPPPAAAAAPAPARADAPRVLFPLIEALDLPGGLMARRGGASAASNEPPSGGPTLSLAPPPPPPPPLPRLVAADGIDMPLPALLRLIAEGEAASAEAFSAMRRPVRADRQTT